MFPAMLDLSVLNVAVAGNGPAAARRVALLRDGGARRLTVYAPEPGPEMREQAGGEALDRLPTEAEIAALHVLFVADLPDPEAEALAAHARTHGTLLNTEDVRPLCDFHVPALVRRGDLLLTVSTGGKSPGLARTLRRHFERQFGPEWESRLEELARARQAWREEGLAIPDLMARTEAMIAQKGWLS